MNGDKPIEPADTDTGLGSVSESDSPESSMNSTTPPRIERPPANVTEALKIITAIAQGGDPYSNDPQRRYRPESHPDTVKALCVALSYIVEKISELPGKASLAEIKDARGSEPLEDHLKQIERREIIRALEAAHFNKSEAARRLGMTFRALRYKLEQLGID